MSVPVDVRHDPPAPPDTPSPHPVRALLLEVLLIAGLLGAYQLGRHLVSAELTTAMHNATRVWHLERALHFPAENDLQRWALRWPPLARLLNLYYVGVHFPVTGLALGWLFFRHRALYLRVRTEMAVLTGAALIVHISFPLAPPRLVPAFGMVDTMLTVGPSAYPQGGTSGFANQYAAMPSLHVGWAVLVAVAVVRAGRGPWRWLAFAHPLATVTVVVVSANHYWLDGVVALLLLLVSVLLVRALHRPSGAGGPGLPVTRAVPAPRAPADDNDAVCVIPDTAGRDPQLGRKALIGLISPR